MSDEIEIVGIRVPRADWEATPASIQMISAGVQVLNERLLMLEEKVNQSSQNLSQQPSTDGFGKFAKGKTLTREKGGDKATGETRKLYVAVCSGSL